MVACVLDDDADLLRRGIERRLCRIAGAVGQCAELHREHDGILGLIQVRGDGQAAQLVGGGIHVDRESIAGLEASISVP